MARGNAGFSQLWKFPTLVTWLLVESSVEALHSNTGSGGLLQTTLPHLANVKAQDDGPAELHELLSAPGNRSNKDRPIHLAMRGLEFTWLAWGNADQSLHNSTFRHGISRDLSLHLSRMTSREWSNTPNDFMELDEGSSSQWLTLAAVVPVVLILDYIIMNLMADGWRNHLMVLALWIICAIAYNVVVFFADGVEDAILWSNGFLLEGLLSLDNLFAYHLIITNFKVPPLLQRKAIFFGILGAMLLRVVMYGFLAHILYAVTWFRFLLGAVIIYSGIQGALTDIDDEESMDANSSWCVQAVRFVLGDRLWNQYVTENGHIFVEKDGKWRASLLLVVIVFLEAIDVVFACDSVSAKLAVIPDQYICYSSSIFAMFALRGMFFLVKELIETFYLLKYGMAFILLAIGLQLIVSPWYDCPPLCVLVFTIIIFVVCMLGSKVLGPQLSDPFSKVEAASAASP